MKRLSTLAFACTLAFTSSVALAQAADKPAEKKPAATAAKKPVSQSRKELNSKAKGMALATETIEQINQNQLDIATRVMVGKADCEFNQAVSVEPLEGKPGHFKVGYKGSSYVMIPQETTTGAVRLEDKRNGMMWLQIPSKSMLMNSKIGQRMVDACTMPQQRAGTNPVATTVAHRATP